MQQLHSMDGSQYFLQGVYKSLTESVVETCNMIVCVLCVCVWYFNEPVVEEVGLFRSFTYCSKVKLSTIKYNNLPTKSSIGIFQLIILGQWSFKKYLSVYCIVHSLSHIIVLALYSSTYETIKPCFCADFEIVVLTALKKTSPPSCMCLTPHAGGSPISCLTGSSM